jgi:DNA-binding transcriptional LysR family regulator
MNPPELRQLRYFVAVAEELNFTRAAQRVHVVQQGLSGAIAQLEQQLGARLFLRTTRRVELTDAGVVLLPYARETLAAADRGVTALAEVVGGHRRQLRVGLAMTAGLSLTPTLLRCFEARNADVDLVVRHFDFQDPSGGLRDDASDVAIVRSPFSAAGISMRELLSERRYAVLGSAHPLARTPALRLDQLLDVPWIRVDTDPIWWSFWRAAGERMRSSPPGPHCASINDLCEAARSMRGTGLVPESIANSQHWPGVSFVQVVDVPMSTVVAAWREADERAIVKDFVTLAGDLSRSGSPAGSCARTST